MHSHYILIQPSTRLMIRVCRGIATTYNIAFAKMFTSEWSANKFRNRLSEPDAWTVKKITVQ